jgi:alkylhydroperoxidase family enzyme
MQRERYDGPVTTTARTIESTLVAAPDAADHLADAYEAACEAIEPRLFKLIRLRVAMLLGCTAELDDVDLIAHLPQWPTSVEFSEQERACLAFVEQFIIDVASMPDHLVHDVQQALGDTELIDFTHALLVIEQRQRLTLAWNRVLEGAN